MHYEHISKCTIAEAWEKGAEDEAAQPQREREIDVKFQVMIQICGMLRLF